MNEEENMDFVEDRPKSETASIASDKVEPDSNESTLVKAAKALVKAISMCRIGTDRRKMNLLLETLADCDNIIKWDERNESLRIAERPSYPLR